MPTIPFFLHRWVWRHRRLEQLARLLARKHPRVGDQLLGIIELAHNEFEQARSPALCEAAIREVARDAEKVDFEHAVPHPAASALAGAGGRSAGDRGRPAGCCSRRRPRTPGSGSWRPGAARRATRSPRSRSCPTMVVAARRAVLGGHELEDKTAWRPSRALRSSARSSP